jgi:hypothetical protein
MRRRCRAARTFSRTVSGRRASRSGRCGRCETRDHVGRKSVGACPSNLPRGGLVNAGDRLNRPFASARSSNPRSRRRMSKLTPSGPQPAEVLGQPRDFEQRRPSPSPRYFRQHLPRRVFSLARRVGSGSSAEAAWWRKDAVIDRAGSLGGTPMVLPGSAPQCPMPPPTMLSETDKECEIGGRMKRRNGHKVLRQPPCRSSTNARSPGAPGITLAAAVSSSRSRSRPARQRRVEDHRPHHHNDEEKRQSQNCSGLRPNSPTGESMIQAPPGIQVVEIASTIS